MNDIVRDLLFHYKNKNLHHKSTPLGGAVQLNIVFFGNFKSPFDHVIE